MKHSKELTSIWKDFIESPAGIIADGFMNSIPGYNGAWISLKNAIEQSKNMKVLRGIELLELFGDTDFQDLFLKSEQAVDGLGLCFESITKQRNQEKREIIKKIFLGFIELTEEEKEKFLLERMLHLVNTITFDEILVLKSLYKDGKDFIDTTWGRHDMDSIHGLVGLGIFSPNYATENAPYDQPRETQEIGMDAELSSLGKSFIKYIINDNDEI